MDKLGTEMNNVAYFSLGTMLHLNIQKEKEAMKTSHFQKQIVGTAACMKILMMATEGFGQIISNDNYFYYIWFSGVKTDEEAMAEGVDYCGTVKTVHKVFCIAIF